MKSEKILNAIGQISDEKITEADTEKAKPKTVITMWRVLAPIAAACFILIAGVLVLPNLLGDPAHNQPNLPDPPANGSNGGRDNPIPPHGDPPDPGAPPYGYATDNMTALLADLETYIDGYPEGIENFYTGYGQPREGYILKNRNVFWVDIDDPSLNLRWCGYNESSWGGGVNYIYIEFAKTLDHEVPADLGVTIYFGYDDPDGIYQYELSHGMATEVIFNGKSYAVEEHFTAEWSRVTFVHGDALVVVHERNGLFDESRLGHLKFMETDLVLPVYVFEGF